MQAVPDEPAADENAPAELLVPAEPKDTSSPAADEDPETPAPTVGVDATEVDVEEGASSTGAETIVEGLADGATVEPPTTAEASDPKRWRKRATIGAAVVVVLALIALAGRTHLETRDDLSDARAELAATAETLSSTEDTLDETSSELEDTSAVLDETERQLQTRTSERDTLQAEVQALETELEGVRGSLVNAEQRITLQSGEITNLRSCLQGVANALFYITDGYYSAALGAIEAVEVSCNAAMNSI